MINYFYDCYRILNKVYSEKTFIKQAISQVDIEEKNKALTVKTCYGVLDKDIELSYIIKQLTDKSPKLVIRTILKIAMYDIKYLGKKEYAVTQNAVELVKKLGKGGASGFVNAFLRKFISYDLILPSEPSLYLSIKYSYPEFAVKELLRTYGKERTESIIKSTNEKTTLVFYDTEGDKYLDALNVPYKATPFDNVYILDNFVRNADFEKGVYTYQALGSVAICDAVSPCDKILDCCAAPGGKSVRLSYKCKSVVACDIHEHRVKLIESYAKRMNRNNIIPIVADSKAINGEFIDSFDAVLCDAPCSGLGVVSDNPDIKLNRNPEDILSLNKEQISILNNVCKYVKIGGYLYYSTCSVLDLENIDIINEFLKNHDNYEFCDVDSKLSHEKKDKAIAFLPDISEGLGFFVAKLKRIK